MTDERVPPQPAAEGTAAQLRLMRRIIHDARNPLAAVLLYARLLQRKAELPPELHRYLEMIVNEAKAASVFLQDMLLLMQSDEKLPSLQRTQCTAADLLRPGSGQAAGPAADRGISIALEPALDRLSFSADADLLARSFTYIMAYAVRSAHANSTVSVRSAPPAPPYRARIEFYYNGEPLEEALRAGLFDKYAAADLRAGGIAGAGLELPFAALVVRAHGGALAAHNTAAGVVLAVEL